MKFKVGDTILVTAGKDKGRKGTITKVLPLDNKVLVEGVNVYVKHVKPAGDRAGQRLSLSRPLPTANVAILNDKGEVDRIGYQVTTDGQKTRIFRKTGQAMAVKTEKK